MPVRFHPSTTPAAGHLSRKRTGAKPGKPKSTKSTCTRVSAHPVARAARRRPSRRGAVVESTPPAPALDDLAGIRCRSCDDQIEIDEEFASLCPAHGDDERISMCASLQSEGCRDALVHWKGTKKLIDGHRRREYCTELGILFRVVDLDFPDREAVKDWIRRNQLGRRNNSPVAKAVLRGECYLAASPQHGGDRKSSRSLTHLISAARVAEQFRVDPGTIRDDAKLALAVKSIVDRCGRGAREAMLRPDSGATRAWVLRAAAADAAEQTRLIEQLIAERKVRRRPRTRRRDDGFLALPLEPKSLAAQVLLEHYGPAGIAELIKELATLRNASSPRTNRESFNPERGTRAAGLATAPRRPR